jgi:hypothetical protein
MVSCAPRGGPGELTNDLGGRESQVCVRAPDGQILREMKLASASIEQFLRRQPPSRVVLETCAEAFRVADVVLDCKHEVSRASKLANAAACVGCAKN